MSLYSLAATASLGWSLFLGVTTGCTETIRVLDVDFRLGVPCESFDFPCEDLEGDYYFSGPDSDGLPTYTKPRNGMIPEAYFSVYVEDFNPNLASLAFTFEDAYFAPTWDHSADVTFINDVFQVEAGALEGETNIVYFPQPGTNLPPLYIVAELDDCENTGLDIEDPDLVCPSYDFTEYSDCYDDENCANCQHWGCARCKDGYYKMGLFMRCQSCEENYPGCSECNDWSGCGLCRRDQPRGRLSWNAICRDEVCSS